MKLDDYLISKLMADKAIYSNSVKNEIIKLNSLVKNIDTADINDADILSYDNNKFFSGGHNNTWEEVFPVSCKIAPLYFTPTYPWTYRMSAKIDNYFFGKKPIDNILTFNVNLPQKHQLRGSYFFSNHDTTNYGKMDIKKINMYRVYPSLQPDNLLPSTKFIYKPSITNQNLAYLPADDYGSLNDSATKFSGTPWFMDSISHAFLRRYFNMHPYNILSREIDSVISMFNNKLSFIFNPMSAVYDLQRTFTFGLSPTSKIFMPEKYLRNDDLFFKRFSLWSHKYNSFWNNIKMSYNVYARSLYNVIGLNTNHFKNNVCINRYMSIITKLQNFSDNSVLNKNKGLNLLANKYQITKPCSDLFYYLGSDNKIFAKNNRLVIDIKQGKSLVSNMAFSTKKLIVINTRNLFHYYPFSTKKPYGTGIKQLLHKKTNKFNKNKITMSNQILKLNYICQHNLTTFNKFQQLSKWMPYNINEHSLWGHKFSLLNVLSLKNPSTYLPKINSYSYKKDFKNLTSGHKLNRKHFSTMYNNSQKFITQLYLNYYLLYNQYNKKHLLYSNKKWFTNLNKRLFINKPKFTRKSIMPISFEGWLSNMLKKGGKFHELLFAKKKLKWGKKLTGLQSMEKNMYLIYKWNLSVYHKLYGKYLKNIRIKGLSLWLKQIRTTLVKQKKIRSYKIILKAKRKKFDYVYQKIQNMYKIMEQQQKARQLKFEQLKKAEELKVQAQILAEKQQKLRLLQEQKVNKNKFLEVPQGHKLPKHIWASLEEAQRTHYHIHQKKLLKESRAKEKEMNQKKVNKN